MNLIGTSQARNSESTCNTLQVPKDPSYIKPLVWSLNIYDNHLASKLHPQPKIQELTRRIRGQSPKLPPHPLPQVRKRTLTNPLPPLESMKSLSASIRRSQQIANTQSTSSFLSKLPFEIRLDIYESLLTDPNGQVVHVIRKNGKFGHWRCRIHNNESEICDQKGSRCLEGWLAYRANFWHLDQEGNVDLRTDGGLLSLLLTCRVVYSEAIGILYERNRFHFNDPRDIGLFRRSVVPQRFRFVRSIVVDWGRSLGKGNSIPEKEWKVWEDSWGFIRGMEGLQHVKVVIKTQACELSNETRRQMCQPMMEVGGLKNFELLIPGDNEENWEFAANAPFRIIRAAADI